MADSFPPRDRILGKLDGGGLPRKGPSKMYAGYGHGDWCTACDRTITPDDIEYEMEFDDGVVHRMHRDCADVWQAECERRGSYRTSA